MNICSRSPATAGARENDAVTLPVASPSIISYLHYAHELTIAETDSRSRAYLALAFLQLHTRIDNTGIMMIDFYAHERKYHPISAAVSRELVSPDELRDLGRDAVEKACQILDERSYLRVNLDEYYVRESSTYMKEGTRGKSIPVERRPVHFNLIYGYSRVERTFFTHGFDMQGHYGQRKIGFDELSAAYYGDDVGMWRWRLLESGTGACSYSPTFVIDSLTGFIESRCVFGTARKDVGSWNMVKTLIGRHPEPARDRMSGNAFGMGTYDAALAQVAWGNGKVVDIRPWCVFCDHKRALLRLCAYLADEQGVPVGANIVDGLTRIEADFFKIRNLLIEARLSDRTVKFDTLARNIERLRSAEKEVIGEMIAALRSTVGDASGRPPKTR